MAYKYVLRDQRLDIVKGLAIILVIIGHTFQGMYSNYDDFLGFKVIYSFHMPLFVFVSGAVASIGLESYLVRDSYEVFRNFIHRVSKAFIRLIVPFFTWTLIKYQVDINDGDFHAYCSRVFHSPDFSLWFLLLIFYCLLFFNLVLAFILIVESFIEKTLTLYPVKRLKLKVCLILILIIWLILKPHMPNYFGILYLKKYFIYFIFGCIYHTVIASYPSGKSKFVFYIVFSLTVPFWHRTFNYSLDPVVTNFVDCKLLLHSYKYLVAITGIMIFLDIGKIIDTSCSKKVKSILILCGSASLGIYAIHFYFLGLQPLIIAPLLLSLFLYLFFMKVPLLNFFLFGESGFLKARK